MGKLSNPHDALASLQSAIASGELQPSKGGIDPTLGVLVDHPNGEPRLTYVRLEGGKVVALVMAIQCEPVEGARCYNLGYAVAAKYRGKGRAKETVAAALAEMRVGLGQAGVEEFYVEAVVGLDNLASLKVAEHAIAPVSTPGVCSASGVPMRQFLRQLSTK